MSANIITFIVYAIVALVCGALIALQASTNAVLLGSIGNVLVTATILFAIGLAYLLTLMLIIRPPIPSLVDLADNPLWAYVGGIVVASYVLVITFLVPRIGVGTAIILVVSGQILFAVAIDHFGLISGQVYRLDAKRVIGIVSILVGIGLARA